MRSFFWAGLLLTIFFLNSNPASAQSDSLENKAVPAAQTDLKVPANAHLWTFKFSPQHLIVGGYYFELEKRISSTSNHSFIVAPQFYSAKGTTVENLAERPENSQVNNIHGFGAQFMHRIYRPDPVRPNKKQYFAYGFNFHNFTVDYAVLGWGKVVESNGIEYYRYLWHQKQDKVKRVGAIAMFGSQNPIFSSRFITDIYGGIGLRSGSTENNAVNQFNANILDYGSSGLYLAMGIKLGYSF